MGRSVSVLFLPSQPFFLVILDLGRTCERFLVWVTGCVNLVDSCPRALCLLLGNECQDGEGCVCIIGVEYTARDGERNRCEVSPSRWPKGGRDLWRAEEQRLAANAPSNGCGWVSSKRVEPTPVLQPAG